MTHTYARRTYEEAKELARTTFKDFAPDHLSLQTINELMEDGILTGGTPEESWVDLIGFVPTEHDFYQFEIYKPSSEKPYIEKSYVRMLSPRTRTEKTVFFIWGAR